MKITRDVVSDLWPLYLADEASADTRALVDAFLREHPELARELRAVEELPATGITMPPDEEARALARTRDLVSGRGWLRRLRLFALAMTGLAILHTAGQMETLYRIAHDAGWQGSTRPLAEAITAGLLWILYVVLVRWQRARALRPSRTS
jgi:hypothetical protein